MLQSIQDYYMLYLILGLAVTFLVILLLRFLMKPKRQGKEKKQE